MPETQTGSFGFLGQKVGPFPLFVWMAGGIGVWYLFFRPKTATGTTADTGVDPSTGQPYASELASSQQQLADLQTQAQATGGQHGFQDNQQWSVAAINYLTSTGDDPAQANEAIQQYLNGQQLTPQQQSLVSLAISVLGAPPSPPGPTGTPPGQVAQPPGVSPPPPSPSPKPSPGPAQVNRYPAPGGLKVLSKTATSATVQWNNTTPPAKSFTVATYTSQGRRVGYSTVDVPDATGGHGTYTITGLSKSTAYKAEVWANGGKVAPPHATAAFTTAAKL